MQECSEWSCPQHMVCVRPVLSALCFIFRFQLSFPPFYREDNKEEKVNGLPRLACNKWWAWTQTPDSLHGSAHFQPHPGLLDACIFLKCFGAFGKVSLHLANRTQVCKFTSPFLWRDGNYRVPSEKFFHWCFSLRFYFSQDLYLRTCF
jgi:hypothetical protein